MTFTAHLEGHLKRHPAMRPTDVIKMCYQAARGAEHLLADPCAARRALEAEYDALTPKAGELYEPISDRVIRVSLAAFKATGMPLDWLYRMFLASQQVRADADTALFEYLTIAEGVVARGLAGFSAKEFADHLADYRESGMPAVHHSEEYRIAERPAYRIVDARFGRILPILQRVCTQKSGDAPRVIAIDGRAASGKTTLAAALCEILDADLIHMDDFFVPPSLRSPERFKTPGQNIHHERFATEVLPYLSRYGEFAYRVFDCGRMDYNGTHSFGKRPYRIVEGSYSHHPLFGDYADVTVFSDVTSDEQAARIRVRNGDAMLSAFLTRWIPMEEAYFSHFAIDKKADLRV